MAEVLNQEQVLVNEDTLTTIADSVRLKLGEETNPNAAGFTKYTPMELANKIANEMPLAKDAIPNSAKHLTGDCKYRFANGGWDWFIEQCGEEITTRDITTCNSMFSGCRLTKIPFDINLRTGLSNVSLDYMFYDCHNLTELPKIIGKPFSMQSSFHDCKKLEYILEEFYKDIDWIYFDNNSANGGKSGMFTGCFALRSVPSELLKHNVINTSLYSSYLYNGFTRCYALDELRDLPLSFIVNGWTNNGFYNTFKDCHRLKAITFELNQGQPLVLKLKNQTINLDNWIGYASGDAYITDYTYITKETNIKDDATYQALKNNPDSWTSFREYSRYNHDSAVETINSLPDTSAYLAANGGTNTISFRGAAGSATDGGAINTLTEAEIAVAAAKGWTVSLV